MAKRKKTIIAGALRYCVVYTVPNPRDGEHVRKKIRQVSAEAVARMNCNTAQRKLELLMATNFAPTDLVVTLTYRDADLPTCFDDAKKCTAKFIRLMRSYRSARGDELRAITVTEGLHGDHRIHHHIVMNATGRDIETIRELWTWGDDVQLNYIWERGYDGWAGYLSKERRQASLNGKRMFSPTRNLRKPIVQTEWVSDDTTVEAPPGAVDVVESGDRNEYASYRYVKYRLPNYNFTSAAQISDSKQAITYGRRRTNTAQTVDKLKK